METMHPNDEYVGAFCPNCGFNLTEEELDNDHDLPAGRNEGSVYTCGYCKRETTDWNHVKRCRLLHSINEELQVRGVGLRLAEIVQEFERGTG